jgi:ssDNA-binding replication factor A large subunit
MTILDDGTIKIVVEIGISDTEVSINIKDSVDLENFSINTTDIDDICASIADELKALFDN